MRVKPTVLQLEHAFVVSPTVKNAEDCHHTICDIKGNHRPLFIVSDAQARAYVITQGSAKWECPQALAVIDDGIAIARRHGCRGHPSNLAGKIRELYRSIWTEDDTMTHDSLDNAAARRARTSLSSIARDGSAFMAS